MYRNIKSYELRYTDVDAYDSLKFSSLLAFLEESACLSADELGFGYADVAPRNIGFVVVNYYIRLERRIKLGDVLTVHTWPLKPKHIIFLRDYELYCGDEKVGVATARWGMIDTKTFSLLPSSAYFKDEDFANYNTERSTQFSSWKIPSINAGEDKLSHEVVFSDYDHYFHVNNTKYADFLMDVFSPEELENKAVECMQITFVKQCKIGDVIQVSRQYVEGFYLIEGKVDGELRVQMKVKFNGV
ncbi:MAG: hypothetical protein K2I30_00770 [Clostridia bacterium]|nr:hypothetical protein [Clostridia bacterium]